MSRLFDALKGASRFRENIEGTAGEGVWQALGLNGTEGPPALEQTHPNGVTSGAPATVLDQTAPAPVPDSIPLRSPATVLLDQRARLIPNAVKPVVRERYRMLRTKILQEREKIPFRSLVVTSASPQEGKTVTVVNLALSFATLASFRVLMVDGDMRRGTLGSWLGIDDNRCGLSNLIDGSAQLEDVILKSDELPMDFIVRGNPQAHDLHLSHYASHFQKMTEQYDLVMVDSPPVNVITDVQLLAASCEAVLLIARAFATNRKALEEAVHNLQPFRVIGTVLNAGEAQPSYRYNGYYS